MMIVAVADTFTIRSCRETDRVCSCRNESLQLQNLIVCSCRNLCTFAVVVEKPTQVPEDMRDALPSLTPCHGQGSWVPLGADLRWFRPVEWQEGAGSSGEQVKEYLSSASTVEALQLQLENLEKNLWVSEDVERVQLSFLSMNREYGTY